MKGIFRKLLPAIAVAELLAIVGLSVWNINLKTEFDEYSSIYVLQQNLIYSENNVVDKENHTIRTIGSDYEYPIIENVDVHTYDLSKLTTSENNRKSYSDLNCTSKIGIDVSYHQDYINWERVQADGIDFAIIRAGFRTYGTGEIKPDEKFEENIKGASEAGLDVGVYFFSQALNGQEAAEEAEFVIQALSDYDIKYPVVFDWEVIGDETARTYDISDEALTEAALTFCQKIEQAGYTPMIYGSTTMSVFKYDLSQLAEYDFWLAQYYDIPDYPYEFDMWQYSASGVVDGIDSFVDINICFKDYTANSAETSADIQ